MEVVQRWVANELLPIYKLKLIISKFVVSATPYIFLQHTRYFLSQAFIMTLQLYFSLKLPSHTCILLCKYKPNLSQQNSMYYTSSLLNTFPMKTPNSNLMVNPIFPQMPTRRSLMFILSKQILKSMPFFPSPLSANDFKHMFHNHVQTPI